MNSPLESLIESGTKLWLDSIDPQLVASHRELGATGATSNPVIVADLLRTGRFDHAIGKLLKSGYGDEKIAWMMTDQLVRKAQDVFLPIWQATDGDDGYVSFELDPLLEDPAAGLSHEERVQRYIELGKEWAAGHRNRMIKVPATPAGIASLGELAASGVSLNVTLIFAPRQYEAARDAIWSGAGRLGSLSGFKSAYSIFVSRVDVYTQSHVSNLSPQAQGLVGIVNAKRIWQANQEFWAQRATPRKQEIIFASTGTKDPATDAWKYVEAFAGSDIETNPPATNEATQASGLTFTPKITDMPNAKLLDEIDEKVDFAELEKVLMQEGIRKFADPQKALLQLIADKRAAFAAS